MKLVESARSHELAKLIAIGRLECVEQGGKRRHDKTDNVTTNTTFSSPPPHPPFTSLFCKIIIYQIPYQYQSITYNLKRQKYKHTTTIMSGNIHSLGAPPPYSEASSTTAPSRPNNLEVPRPKARNGISPEERRSMEDEGRELPEGWVRTYDPDTHHQVTPLPIHPPSNPRHIS